MDDQLITQLTASAQQLAAAAEALENLVSRFDAQHQELSAKVERIVAAVEETHTCAAANPELQTRVAELERANAELKAQAARLSRKTLPPLVTALLAKNACDDSLDPAALDKALSTLSVEQRIAVKAEMARAGMIE